MAAPAFDYGNLLTAQARGNYQVQRQGAAAAQAALGNTQNWAGLAAATSQSAAQRDVATINYGGIAQQGISSKASVAVADKAIEQEKARRGSGIGAIAGAAAGLAGLFID